MERAKINAGQLFVLIFLFEMGSALLLSLGIEAKQDAWLAVLTGMCGSLFLFWMYYRLYLFYPDMLPTSYMQHIFGPFFGKIAAYLYILLFMYNGARVLRDFGEMLVTSTYTETPLFIINALLLLIVLYVIHKGIEVIARTGEILFVVLYVLAVTGSILIVVSGLINIDHLKPVLEGGIGRILKTAGTETLYVPFGEAVVFFMILPYVNRPDKIKPAMFSALVLSGINLTITMAVNIAVLGVDLTERSQFPLLNTIQAIQVAEFLERLDVFFMIAIIVGGFVKISIYFYAVVIGVSDLFRVKEISSLIFPLGLVLLFLSMVIASGYAEHIKEGLRFVPLYMHLPLHVILPALLLTVAALKKRHSMNKRKQS
ncbi:GerAB/ArcD/ProY family transporter [Salibacterium halotolerans]|uniref:Spore germination protein KB n=1 Tax=Salibacterium halotolerans TaxID=1884432 RepID=A0A1I5W277_9BACI|nr:GerAB/ArcD/ProY family transporter [Salibacterium halotolerans]SFQ13874.1 spore germination protein KB [Salibacterium halotolerans]